MRLHHVKDDQKLRLPPPFVEETEETVLAGALISRDQRGFDLHRRLAGLPEPLELVDVTTRRALDADVDIGEWRESAWSWEKVHH
jgi:hypothetical protein